MRLLLLAGTGEARELASALASEGVDAVASLAGATEAPKPLALPVRVGGFGGEAEFRSFLEREGIGAVLDATHPYAAQISARTAHVCDELGMPYCQFLRPEWEVPPGWIVLKDEAELATHVPDNAVIFLATGRQSLARYVGLERQRVYCRVVDQPNEAFPFRLGGWLVGAPLQDPDDEEDLFRSLGVDWLVVKNSGGSAGRAKLVAAQRMGLNVAVIARPAQPEGRKVDTVEAALDWVGGLRP